MSMYACVTDRWRTWADLDRRDCASSGLDPASDERTLNYGRALGGHGTLQSPCIRLKPGCRAGSSESMRFLSRNQGSYSCSLPREAAGTVNSISTSKLIFAIVGCANDQLIIQTFRLCIKLRQTMVNMGRSQPVQA